MHPSKLLWQEHFGRFDYPDGVMAVPEPVRGTAFFPGGYGLIVDNGALPAFPHGGTMIVGHDFHSEAGYRESVARGHENPNLPTWRNLRSVLKQAGISTETCFFTNFFVGLRKGTATTGPFPGAKSHSFVAHCREFLLRQLEVQQPALILTLGIQTPYYLAPLSPQLADWGERRGLKHLDASGPVKLDVHFPAIPSCSAAVVALTHPCLRHASVRHRSYDGLTGAAAELRMLEVAIESVRR
ncbi:MAG TPA: uracil-DNA glycosylase family protein [Kofleriaceae bacterium]|nr:uracil-DNA glycosylase family protein [Kofleriaceae bacterium]